MWKIIIVVLFGLPKRKAGFGPQPATAGTWKKITTDADQSSDIIAANLMSRRK
jgi:hypothetical protein